MTTSIDRKGAVSFIGFVILKLENKRNMLQVRFLKLHPWIAFSVSHLREMETQGGVERAVELGSLFTYD